MNLRSMIVALVVHSPQSKGTVTSNVNLCQYHQIQVVTMTIMTVKSIAAIIWPLVQAHIGALRCAYGATHAQASHTHKC